MLTQEEKEDFFNNYVDTVMKEDPIVIAFIAEVIGQMSAEAKDNKCPSFVFLSDSADKERMRMLSCLTIKEMAQYLINALLVLVEEHSPPKKTEIMNTVADEIQDFFKFLCADLDDSGPTTDLMPPECYELLKQKRRQLEQEGGNA